MNKVLARAGLGSRRAVEELILQGRVTVDGQVARDLATRVDPRSQKIALDGERVRPEKIVYIAVHKPKGYVSTNHDPAGKPRVVDLVPELPQRVYPIGRLDEDSNGLILLTNDGELANRLAHPRYGVEKVYRVLVAGQPGPEVLDKVVQGVWLSEGKARARDARFAGKQGEATALELTLAEGKNREVRRILAKLGHKVMSLTRIAVGPVTLKGLAVGQWRYLEPGEVAMLRRVAEGESIPAPIGGRRDRTPRRASTKAATGGPPRPRSGMGHLVGSADQGKTSRSGGARRERDRDRDRDRGGQAGVPRRGAIGSFAAPPGGGPSRRRTSRRGGEADEVLVPPVSGPAEEAPPPSSRGRGSRGGPPRSQAPAGRRPSRGGPAEGGPPSGPSTRRMIGLGNAPPTGEEDKKTRRPPRKPKPLPKSRRSRRANG